MTTAERPMTSSSADGRLDRRVSLDTYRLLGNSGLRVSPLALGTMTFGTDWGWGADREEARRMFDAYVERGGNFIDSANGYTGGTSERFVGEFADGRRDRLVIATKYSVPTRAGDPNSGGNHRRSMVRSVEESLRRLRTEYIDLLYLHIWDGTTPVEEILRAMDDLVRAGKVVYVGISDTPAWQVSRMQAIAQLRGWAPLVALQIEYSLIERTVERELIPMAREMGLGVIPWSPLASGVLTGKYSRADLDGGNGRAEPTGSRKNVAMASGALTERGLRIAERVKDVAAELGTTRSRVALAWTLLNPAVTAPIIGARTLPQLEDNLGALELDLPDEHRARLDEASAVELGFPHDFLARPMTQNVMTGGVKIAPRA
jgi:aryl-alcohol dehydrogenase-like predicted oxidoreductase